MRGTKYAKTSRPRPLSPYITLSHPPSPLFRPSTPLPPIPPSLYPSPPPFLPPPHPPPPFHLSLLYTLLPPPPIHYPMLPSHPPYNSFLTPPLFPTPLLLYPDSSLSPPLYSHHPAPPPNHTALPSPPPPPILPPPYFVPSYALPPLPANSPQLTPSSFHPFPPRASKQKPLEFEERYRPSKMGVALGRAAAKRSNRLPEPLALGGRHRQLF